MDIRWAGGLFTGEGCTDMHKQKNRRYRYLRMRITMTDEQTVLDFASIVQHGRVHGPYRPPKGPAHHKPKWMWSVSGRRAHEVLERLRPHLSDEKLIQAANVIGGL